VVSRYSSLTQPANIYPLTTYLSDKLFVPVSTRRQLNLNAQRPTLEQWSLFPGISLSGLWIDRG
jgi:hypothetical protein